ncbi:hypothetical protein BDV26DRAFT_290090 [Aspergillus bertholletiae]|uniref:Uncharacterized protein n=1 Tax=Aspergillus bertholletiae TaxID=1226010 RepID=A0A5N7BGI6_9EURO|nr:hypothetical protein BDV26DRAFT_290090 [Aspergillus bertholletiae]
MSLLRRQPALSHQNRLFSPLKHICRRRFSTPPASPTPKDSTSRLRKLNDRLPSFLRVYTTPLLGAPGTHITSFLILHEITAIIPLFGLVTAFHYGNWLPDLTSSNAFEEGTRRFGRWLRKRGWVEDVDVDTAEMVGGASSHDPITTDQMAESDKKGVRLVLEFATAYAVTKALLPLRIATSVWATPWFARVIIIPMGKGARKLFGRK